MAKDINDSDFEKDVIEASKEKAVVVDFWASWCGPCQMLKPILEAVAKDYADKMTLVKLNVEENQAYASKFGVMSIPAVKMFKDGKVVSEFVGAQPDDKIRAWLDKEL